jgi:hypothetical protein
MPLLPVSSSMGLMYVWGRESLFQCLYYRSPLQWGCMDGAGNLFSPLFNGADVWMVLGTSSPMPLLPVPTSYGSIQGCVI